MFVFVEFFSKKYETSSNSLSCNSGAENKDRRDMPTNLQPSAIPSPYPGNVWFFEQKAVHLGKASNCHHLSAWSLICFLSCTTWCRSRSSLSLLLLSSSYPERRRSNSDWATYGPTYVHTRKKKQNQHLHPSDPAGVCENERRKTDRFLVLAGLTSRAWLASPESSSSSS